MRLRALLGAGIVLALASPSGLGIAEEKKRESAFADARVLEAWFQEALEAAEEICGAPFPKRPTLRVCASSELLDLVREGLIEEFQPQDAKAKADVGARARQTAHEVCAVYQRGLNRVVLVSDLLDEDLEGRPAAEIVRVALAHEAGHAWSEGHGLITAIGPGESGDEASWVKHAVSEGHAHHVAARAAARWGLTPAFEALTNSRAAVPSVHGSEPLSRRLLAASRDLRFPYVTAREYVARVEREGGAAAVARLLKDRPTRTRDLDGPPAGVEARRGPPSPRLSAALTELRSVLPARADVREGDVARYVIRRELGSLPAATADGVVDRYVEGRAVHAWDPFEFEAAVLEFSAQADADAYAVAFEETLRATAGEAATLAFRRDPAPHGIRLSASAVPRKPSTGRQGRLLLARRGSYVLILATAEREAWGEQPLTDAMNRALAALADPAAAAK